MLPDYIQYGFAGFAFILMAVIVWLIGKLFAVIDRFHEAVMANARALDMLQQTLERFGVMLNEVLDKLEGILKGRQR